MENIIVFFHFQYFLILWFPPNASFCSCLSSLAGISLDANVAFILLLLCFVIVEGCMWCCGFLGFYKYQYIQNVMMYASVYLFCLEFGLCWIVAAVDYTTLKRINCLKEFVCTNDMVCYIYLEKETREQRFLLNFVHIPHFGSLMRQVT